MATAQNWLILIYQSDGVTLRASYSWTTDTLTYVNVGGPSPYTFTTTPTYAYVEQIDWSVERSGNCLGASFVGDSHGFVLDIQPRDVTVICTLGHLAGETTSYYYPRFRGVAKTPANPLRSDGAAHAYAFDGLYKAAYYVRTPKNKNYASGADIGGLLTSWAQDQYDAASFGMVYSDGAGYAALAYAKGKLPCGMYVRGSSLGVTSQAAINPGAASLGQYLDKLTQLSTSAGTKTAWGVDRYGGVFIKKKGATNLSLTEGDHAKQVVVSYPDVQAQEVIERIQWVVADGDADHNVAYGAGDKYSLDTPDTLTHSTALNDSLWGDMSVPKQVPSGVNVFKELDVTLTIDSSHPFPFIESWVGGKQDHWGLAADTPAGDYSSAGIALGKTSSGLAGDVTVSNAIPAGGIVCFSGSSATYPNIAATYLELTRAAQAGDTIVYGVVHNGTLPINNNGSNLAIVQTRFLEGDPIAYNVWRTNTDLAASLTLNMPSGITSLDIVKAQAHLQLDAASPNIVSGTQGQFRYYLQVDSTMSTYGAVAQQHMILTGSSPQTVDKGFVFGDRARSQEVPFDMPSVKTVGLTLDFVNGTIGAGQSPLLYDLQDFRVFSLNTDLLDGLAQQEFKPPKLNVVAVTVKGEEAPADTLTLSLASGVTVTAEEIDRFEYSIYGGVSPGAVPRGGVRTTIHTGERGLPEQMYLVNAIKRHGRNAVLHGKGAA